MCGRAAAVPLVDTVVPSTYSDMGASVHGAAHGRVATGIAFVWLLTIWATSFTAGLRLCRVNLWIVRARSRVVQRHYRHCHRVVAAPA